MLNNAVSSGKDARMGFFKNLFEGMSRDLIVIFKVIVSGVTAGFLIFFISALMGVDLKKNTELIQELETMYGAINQELSTGIDARIQDLGEVPKINPYRKYYAAEFAKEIHEISYLTEKQKILFDDFNVRAFENKSQNLVNYSMEGNVIALNNELDIVKRELKNSANLIDKKRKTLTRQRTAYIVFFFLLWIAVYIYYSRGVIKRR
jgi:hypothetical protein